MFFSFSPQLTDPLEVGVVADVLIDERSRDVTSVHLHHDERAHYLALEVRQVPPH